MTNKTSTKLSYIIEIPKIKDEGYLCFIEGNLPGRVVGLVTEWAIIHKEELKEDWKLLKEEKALKKIAPLV